MADKAGREGFEGGAKTTDASIALGLEGSPTSATLVRSATATHSRRPSLDRAGQIGDWNAFRLVPGIWERARTECIHYYFLSLEEQVLSVSGKALFTKRISG
jgi:hypothetical protein